MKAVFPTATGLALLGALFLATARPAVGEETVTIRLGTILPSGTAQHALLQELGERWRQESGGTVKLVLYPDGRLGGESEMVKKLRIKQINAALFSVAGLKEIDATVAGLQMLPRMFHSWEEVDYVREHIRAQLEQRLRAKGFEVLCWADAGWVQFFSKTPATRPAEFSRMKMFAWSGDEQQIAMMQSVDFNPVPLETSDILMGLNTGMITTVALPPFAALAGRINGSAPHLLDMNWVPMVGAVIVRTDAWEKIPAATRAKMLAAAEETGAKLRERGRRDSEDSVRVMQQHGLQVHRPSPEDEKEWQTFSALLRSKIRGTIVPADIFDAVERHLRDYRAAHGDQP
jgi:TRAP-type C4-dicarboxylate transport system substrate-binding protein